jgi:hypothetical protein
VRLAVEFDAAPLERHRRRSRRVWHLIRLAGVAHVHSNQTVGDPPVETRRFLNDPPPAHDPLGLAASWNFEPASAERRALNNS